MSEQRLIDVNDIVKVAEHAYDQWNLAMAAADGQREINLCFKRQELCKVVKAVAEDAPTIDPETLPIVQELREKLARYENGWISVKDKMPPEQEGTTEIYDPEAVAFVTSHKSVSELVIVLVIDEDGNKYVCDDITFNGKWVNSVGEVTHWMSLPELPETAMKERM